jgi:ubiquinone/menaquinone biosynthesis C-methylase UbiE
MGIFRRSQSEPLPVTMAGVKLGDRLLSLGVRDTRLIAALATRAGLTGRACAVDPDQTRVPAAAAAIEREGALVEVAHAPGYALPFDAGSFDVAIARDTFSEMSANDTTHVASEALRVLRGGGRLVVIESTKRARISPETLSRALTNAGFAAVRVLAEAEHTIFVEGIKKASGS